VLAVLGASCLLVALLVVAIGPAVCFGGSSRPAAGSPAVAAGSDWVRHDLPLGGIGPTAFTFVDRDHGWMLSSAASGHAVLATSDGGADWSRKASFTDYPRPISVAFADQLHGWMVADDEGSQTVSVTSDGGATWSKKMDYSGPDTKGLLTKVACVSATRSWVVSDGGEVFATADGGATWATQLTPEYSPALEDVCFVDSDHGWAVGDAYDGYAYLTPPILATSDGGKSWDGRGMELVGYDVEPYHNLWLKAVTFVDSQHGFAVGVGESNVNLDWVPVIIATNNGGASWSPQSVPAGTTPGLTDVAFTDVNHGWVVGEQGTVLMTSDGGATWSRQTLQPRTNLVDTCTCDGYGWVLGGNGAVFATTDSGATWSMASLPGDTLLSGIALGNDGHGWAVGMCGSIEEMWDASEVDDRSGMIITTANGGDTWRFQAAPPDVSQLNDVAFSDSLHAWAVGYLDTDPDPFDSALRPVIVATSDGGATWRSQTVPPGVGELEDVAFVDGLHGWAVGGDTSGDPWTPLTLSTSDGGATWNKQAVPADVGLLRGVAFADSSHGWAVDGSSILSTRDGGATWSKKDMPGRSVLGVACTDANHAWVAGEDEGEYNGTAVFTTSDGGDTWHTHLMGVVGRVEHIVAADTQHGWAAGDDYNTSSNAFVTSDGWAASKEQTLPPKTVLLNDLTCADASHCWAVGNFTEPVLGERSAIFHVGGGGGADMTAPVTKPMGVPASGWTNRPVTIGFTATDDAGGSGVDKTFYRLGTSGAFTEYSESTKPQVSSEGRTTLQFYSIDLAGNAEVTKSATVSIDTHRPTTRAPYAASARRGARATLRYKVLDPSPNGGTATVTIKVRNSAGKVVRTLGPYKGKDINKLLPATFDVPRTWKAGTYRFYVYAKDAAGNAQLLPAGANRLVVR
jgi:photosystem II stability/assembly factor-like uncharacterized protein